MKTSPQPLLAQDSALSAFFDDMLYPQAELSRARSKRVAEDDSPAAVAATNAPQSQVSESDAIQALLLEVAGLTLALPLQAVKDVLCNACVCAPAAGQCATIAGTVTHGEISCRVIDTARLVLPADRAAQLAVDAAERMRCLVVIGDGRWALACNRAGDVIALDRASIKWRTSEGRRPWLAGMVVDSQCALLDVAGLTRLLTDQMA